MLTSQRRTAAAECAALSHVWFQTGNFLELKEELQPGSLDVVSCLSVTKWVHLNQGDEGLRALFARVAELLLPGGYFLLEPQPWRSYKQALKKQVRVLNPDRMGVAQDSFWRVIWSGLSHSD